MCDMNGWTRIRKKDIKFNAEMKKKDLNSIQQIVFRLDSFTTKEKDDIKKGVLKKEKSFLSRIFSSFFKDIKFNSITVFFSLFLFPWHTFLHFFSMLYKINDYIFSAWKMGHTKGRESLKNIKIEENGHWRKKEKQNQMHKRIIKK